MSAREQWFTVREPMPWGGLALDEKPESIDEAIKVAGLDWTILSKPAYFLDNVEEVEKDEDAPLLVNPVPNHFVNVRSDTGAPLGVVTTRYSSFDNIRAFSFLSEIFGSEMDFVSAGHFMGGRRVWVLMQIPAFIEVGGDPIGQYAFVHNSHDGKHSVTAGMTPLRWNCKNLVTTEVRKAKQHDAKRVISLRHLGDMEIKIEEARRVLDVAINYYEQFKVLGDKLAQKKPGKKDISSYLESILPIEEDTKERAARNREESRQIIQKIYEGKGPDGDTQGNAPGSWWCLYNAAIEYADWVRPERKKDGRFQRAIDDPDGFKNAAFELALGGAGL